MSQQHRKPGRPRLPTMKLRIEKKNPKSRMNKMLQSLSHDYPFEQILKYNQIPSVPIIKLNLNTNPINLLTLYQAKYFQYGAVILRANWELQSFFKSHQKPITTRIQKLNQLKKGQNFEQKIQAYSVNSFMQMARKFENDYQFKSPKVDQKKLQMTDKVELEYWHLINDTSRTNNVQVEYAADLSSKKYGSAFSQFEYQDKYFDHQFNLNNVNHQPNSLFQIISSKREEISGVTSPWIYMGMMFSTFCWHTEDMYLASLNYHHEGAQKTWYVIPSAYKEKFDNYVSDGLGKLNKIILQIDPLELIKKKIPVYKCAQNPRDFIFTFPKVYHSGFSHGWNLTEAVNTLLPINSSYLYESLNQEKNPIFPYEWPLIGALENIQRIRFSLNNLKVIKYEIEKVLSRDESEMKKIKSKKIVKIRVGFDVKSSYYANQCKLCQQYCYLSYFACKSCRWKCCIKHDERCSKAGHECELIRRFTNSALRSMVKKLAIEN